MKYIFLKHQNPIMLLWLEKNNVGIDTSKMRPVLDIMADKIKKICNEYDRFAFPVPTTHQSH